MASPMSWEEARDQLRKFREDQSRRSDEVIELWEDVIADFSYKVGDEMWLIYEQVCVAACDCGRLDIAIICIDALKAQFPGSLRVRKLIGMRCEAMERYEQANEVYSSILEEDQTNSVTPGKGQYKGVLRHLYRVMSLKYMIVRKRMIAMLKAQNKISEAIKELKAHLEQYMSDSEAWMELCDLYIAEQEFAKAAFCMEELMMSNPHNHLFHQKFAEIKYTQGGFDNMETARSYFAQAVKLNPHNMRALFGLFMCASNIASSNKGGAKAKKDNIKYAAWAAEQISHRYKAKTSQPKDDLPLALEGMLNDLQITHST